jgi:choline dehydrogenase
MEDQTQWLAREYDYIVVGSGPGGGPVAANLASRGFKVALMEAGGAGTTANYDVPAFFAKACEDLSLQWGYVVHHYDDPEQERRDDKAKKINGEFGAWYPRAGALGGCTSHHCLITIYPHTSDWDHIADVTGDESWRPDKMHQYFQRIERCGYVRPPSAGKKAENGHGFTGWLAADIARPSLLIRDWKVMRIVWAALMTSIEGKAWSFLHRMWRSWRRFPGGPIEFLTGFFDPNDMRTPSFEREGLYHVPFSTESGRRVSVRDILNLAVQDHPNNLHIYTHTLATQVLFEDVVDGSAAEPKAIGVEFMAGMNLYAADPQYQADDKPILKRLRARREVILAAGAFNSPQLLMLSGIGPKAELARHGIKLRVERPGVGRNLQDRYEIGVVSQTKSNFAITHGSTFRRPRIGEKPDPQFAEWLKGRGPYTTNGVLICVTRKSKPIRAEADLVMFCVPGVFKGYYPGWTEDIARNKTQFSWLILKSHTHNRAGSVTLRSNDPRQTPNISFRYFHEGSPGADLDIDAVVEGIEYVRRINGRVSNFIQEELVPGPKYSDRASLRDFVRNEAWGHHASCTNAMGRPDDGMAVVDSRFRVIGTQGLRVVDASVFPRIPGFFITAPIYMIAEKASDAIIADATP